MNSILDNNDNEELISAQKRTISYYKKQFEEGEIEKNLILEKDQFLCKYILYAIIRNNKQENNSITCN
mgnify:CR=1 FL=1